MNQNRPYPNGKYIYKFHLEIQIHKNEAKREAKVCFFKKGKESNRNTHRERNGSQREIPM